MHRTGSFCPTSLSRWQAMPPRRSARGCRRLAAAHSVDGEALPHAVPLAHAALRALRAGRTVPADQAAPEYVRDKVAQTTAERVADES